MSDCRVCGSRRFSILVSSSRLQEECRIRERFVQERLTRPASPEELKDLTQFFHQQPADLLACGDCGLLVRDEHAASPHTYSEDEYDPSLMERIYPRYLKAFRAKEKPYRELLPCGARVLEIGSHYGAFLETARDWGWQAEGVDVGKDTSRFAQSKGFKVHGGEIGDCRFAEGSFDGVFIWNCFDQIEDPKPTLTECRRVVKSGGVLVVRTPSGVFYALCEKLLLSGDLPPESEKFLIEAMGYNNLLGFPYQYGHGRPTLERLIQAFGFRIEGMLNSELLTLPLPDQPAWVAQEERTINSEVRMLAGSVLAQGGTLTGPWIELWFRRDGYSTDVIAC
jgi:SAM-dependent methyltransferase